MVSPYVDYWFCSVSQTRQDFENRFSVSFKGSKNEAFPVKNMEIRHFCKNFKNHVLFFLLMSVLCVVNGRK